jgi:hypothetical protein
MLARSLGGHARATNRPVFDRRPIQNLLVLAALGISVYMLAPPVSPLLSDAELPFFGDRTEQARTLSVGPLPSDFEPIRRTPPRSPKGVLMTGYSAGGTKFDKLLRLLNETELNAVVIDIKDERGEISWLPRSREARIAGAGLPKILDPARTIRRLKKAGIYVIGRIVTFQDSMLAEVRPDLAVQDLGGGIWRTAPKPGADKGLAWLDPYSTEAQDYNIALGVEAIELGFDEIQWDYVRFPTDGDANRIWFRHRDERLPHDVIHDFLARARAQIVPRGAYMSTDLFGLVALVSDDLGIGQKLELIARQVDYISLMLYPSHYNKPEYGIPDPEKEPYKTVSLSINDAKRRIQGTGAKLRPWLQDFSLQVPYTPAEVRAQIDAVEDAGINEWLLWNARNDYTEDAVKSTLTKPPEPDGDAGTSRE